MKKTLRQKALRESTKETPLQKALRESTALKSARRDAFVDKSPARHPNAPATAPPLLADDDDEETKDVFVDTSAPVRNPNSPSTGPPLLVDFDDEAMTARNLGISIQTLMGWRKKGLAPDHIVIARRILYHRDAQREWVLSGGTRGAQERLVAQRPRLRKGATAHQPA